MAIMAVFLGGFVGFISAIVSLIGYDASILSAVGVYFATGLTFTGGAILNAAIHRHEPMKTPVEAQRT